MDDKNYNHHYSVQERVACCFWFDLSRSTDNVQEKYQQRFGYGKNIPTRQEIRLWYQRFIKTGCLIHDDNGNLDVEFMDDTLIMNNCQLNGNHKHSNLLNDDGGGKTTNGNLAEIDDTKIVVKKIGRPKKLKLNEAKQTITKVKKKQMNKRKSKK